MAATRFLQYLNIADFKCFSRLDLNALQRVHLIGGDNNVGKTALLEACYVNCMATDVNAFFMALANITNFRLYPNIRVQRNRSGRFEPLFDAETLLNNFQKFSFRSNLHDILFQVIKEPLNPVFKVSINRTEFSIEAHNLKWKEALQPAAEHAYFLPPFKLPNSEIVELFDVIQLKNQEEYVYHAMQFFDPRITRLKMISGIPTCYVAAEDHYYPLSSFGDGLSHFITILCAIWASEHGQLFIDEIENGIHYTKYEKLWELIFKTSDEAQCQVFATTHSKECIEAFSRVAERYDTDQFKYVNLSRTVDEPEKIVATVLGAVGLATNFDLGRDVR